MKHFKILLAVLFFVGMTGLALAHQTVVDPENGPMVIPLPVYNNDTVTADVGSVVVWTIGDSTGDDDNYVDQTTSADTVLVAGIVYPNDCVAKSRCSIAIFGAVDVDVVETGAGSTIAAGAPLCTSGTAGLARECQPDADAATELTYRHFGFAVGTASSGSVKAFINP